jgi:hypothetical protein
MVATRLASGALMCACACLVSGVPVNALTLADFEQTLNDDQRAYYLTGLRQHPNVPVCGTGRQAEGKLREHVVFPAGPLLMARKCPLPAPRKWRGNWLE